MLLEQFDTAVLEADWQPLLWQFPPLEKLFLSRVVSNSTPHLRATSS